MKIKGKTIVVTGGGNGIGRELVLQLLEKGAQVAIVDIDQTHLEETAQLAGSAKKQLSQHVVDVSIRDQVEAFSKQVIEKHGTVDGLINCAGIIQPFVKVNELNYDTIERLMNINFYGTLYMTKALLPHLLDRPEAHIANVSSMGGFIPFPGQTAYGASKAAVKLFTEGLNVELRDTNVGVTLILPGAVRTDISDHSGLEKRATESEGSIPMLEPDKAAEIMIRAIEKNKFRVLVGKDASFLDKFYRLHPKWAAHYIAKQMKGMVE